MLAEGAAVAAGMCVFALFVRAGLPLVFVSACGLLGAAFVVGRSLKMASWEETFGFSRMSRLAVILTAAGCVLGLALGVAYRWYSDRALLPAAVGWFCPVAAAIGAAEEVVYRGHVLGRFRRLGALTAVVLAAVCHTAYKCALFALPRAATETDILFLTAWTFIGGLVFGGLRELSRGVAPAVAAHVCFDVVVYCELARAPWWVWS